MGTEVANVPPKKQLGTPYVRELLERRDLLWLFGLSLATNGIAWGLMLGWYQFTSVIPLIGVVVILLNAGLSLIFIRKDTVITQAFGVTAVSVQLLLLILIVRTGLLGR